MLIKVSIARAPGKRSATALVFVSSVNTPSTMLTPSSVVTEELLLPDVSLDELLLYFFRAAKRWALRSTRFRTLSFGSRAVPANSCEASFCPAFAGCRPLCNLSSFSRSFFFFFFFFFDSSTSPFSGLAPAWHLRPLAAELLSLPNLPCACEGWLARPLPPQALSPGSMSKLPRPPAGPSDPSCHAGRAPRPPHGHNRGGTDGLWKLSPSPRV